MFFVYQNWTRQRALAHLADCSSCNQGNGKNAIDSGKNGKWHPCETRSQADAFLQTLKKEGYAESHWCKFCERRL